MAEISRKDETHKEKEYDEVPQEWIEDLREDADLCLDNMQAAQEDMAFVDMAGGQWAGFLENEFRDRVKLEIDMVSEAVDGFIAEWDDNRMAAEFKPDDSKTSDKDAELLNGIYRADYRQNYGDHAIDNAVEEAVKCGYGAWKQATRFEDEEDPENENQRTEWRPIYNAYMYVIWHRASLWANKRDATRCVELIPFLPKDFEKKYPGADPVSAYSPEVWENFTPSQSVDIPDRMFIACRYDSKKKTEKAYVYSNLQTGEVEVYGEKDHEAAKDELRRDPGRKFIRERKISRTEVTKVVFSGKQILEKKRRIVGKIIPIIPIYAYRSVVDGVERFRGIVRKLKDAARVFNMQMSKVLENAASNNQRVPIFNPKQILGPDMKRTWVDKNNNSYQLCDALTDPATGQIISAGPVGWTDPGTLDPNTQALLETTSNYIQSRTAATMEETVDKSTSGKMVRELVKRANTKTKSIMGNIADALTLDGEVFQGIASEIYTKERIVRVVGRDGTENMEHLHKQVLDEKTGRLVEANVIAGKKFAAFAGTGPQYDSDREQTFDDLIRLVDVLKDIPAGARYAGPALMIALQNKSGVGMEPLKKLIRRDMVLAGIAEPETDEEKALVQAASQPKKDPTQDLMQAVTMKEMAEAENQKASTVDKIASAEKKRAETEKIRADLGPERSSKILDIRDRLLGRNGTGGA